MSANAQAAGRYYARKNNRLNSAYLVASALFAANPSNADTITIGGVVFTFGAGHVAIGSTTYATLQNLLAAFDQSASTVIAPLVFTVTGGNTLTIYSANVNAPPMTVTASAATVTAATTAQATTRARIPL